MFEHQERVAIFLLLGMAVTVIAAHLILGTIGKQPFAHPFTNNSADGELVIANGEIMQISFTKNGAHTILDMSNLSVFIPSQVAQGLAVQKGDRISVYGIVQTYRGKKEIIISSIDDIRVISQREK